jgi:hypothetical protein
MECVPFEWQGAFINEHAEIFLGALSYTYLDVEGGQEIVSLVFYKLRRRTIFDNIFSPPAHRCTYEFRKVDPQTIGDIRLMPLHWYTRKKKDRSQI